jgi:hypothetical protein
MKTTWKQIPADLGHALWQAYRADMLKNEGRIIGVHESFSDPRGAYGEPCMMTVVGAGSPLLRLETTWTAADRSDAKTVHYLPEFADDNED